MITINNKIIIFFSIITIFITTEARRRYSNLGVVLKKADEKGLIGLKNLVHNIDILNQSGKKILVQVDNNPEKTLENEDRLVQNYVPLGKQIKLQIKSDKPTETYNLPLNKALYVSVKFNNINDSLEIIPQPLTPRRSIYTFFRRYFYSDKGNLIPPSKVLQQKDIQWVDRFK